MTFMTQKWKLQLYFGTFTLNLDLYWKRWKLCEKKEKVWCDPALKRLCTKEAKMAKAVCLFWKKTKLSHGESLMCTWSDVCIACKQILKMESCCPIQECFDRLCNRWWNYAPICFHLWQLAETLKQQPKKGVKCHWSPSRISIISFCILLLMKEAVTLY